MDVRTLESVRQEARDPSAAEELGPALGHWSGEAKLCQRPKTVGTSEMLTAGPRVQASSTQGHFWSGRNSKKLQDYMAALICLPQVWPQQPATHLQGVSILFEALYR